MTPNYVVSKRGNIPVILTSPHGGKLTLPECKERRSCNINDANTNVVVDLVANYLEKNFQKKPYYVTGQARRKYCDLNRSAEDAYEQSEVAPYYDLYHGTIADFIKEIKDQHPHTIPILLDIHGQSAKENDILRGTCNGKTYPLLMKKYGFKSVVGKNSIFGHLSSSGIPVYPDCNVPYDGVPHELKGFTGGFTVQYYSGIHATSNPKDSIDCFQIEIGRSFRRPKTHFDTLDNFSLQLATAIDQFLNEYSKS